MHCPRCDWPNYDPTKPCRHCHFKGDPAAIEALQHTTWLLSDMGRWPEELELDPEIQQRLEQYYTRRRKALEVELALREPPFTAEEAPRAWVRLRQLEELQTRGAAWREQDYLSEVATRGWVEQLAQASATQRERLEGHTPPSAPLTDAERQADLEYFLATIVKLEQHRAFFPHAAAKAREPLLAELAALKTTPLAPPASEARDAPARPSVSPAPARPTARPYTRLTARPVAAPATPAPRPPAMPLRERLWRALISERTLNAILFLGIFLLLAAAISFVVWGWQSFPPPIRVAIPTGLTALFFLLGWGIRTKTSMYNSGIALSAVAALFIPVDFYTFYVNSHISPEWGGEFWLLTSVICLVAYTVIALRVQSRVFGYLVSIAAGSVVLSGIETVDLSRDWYAAGLTILAAGLIWVASRINRSDPAGRWRVLAEPFRYVALLTVGVLMPATLAWRIIDRSTFDTLHYALTVTWWVGGFVLGWGAVHYRSRSLGHAAALALPAAVYLAQAALFDWAEINPAWHALGWALLVNVYFVAGYRFSHHADAVVQEHGRTANRWGTALLLAAAFWSLTDLSSGAATAASHALLVGAVVLAVFLWKRPRYFYAASLLSVTAVTFTMSELDLPLAQVCVGWVSLALLHVMAALALGRRFPTGPNFAAPLVIAGYIIGVLALLPPALPYDSGLLLYTLGNWMALAAWGAYLAHTGARGFVWRRTEWLAPFHWLVALPLPFWLWVLFDHRDVPVFALVLALAALAWGLVALSYRLRCLAAAYRWPWYVMGLAVSVAAPVAAGVVAPEGFAPALCLLSAGLLYFVDAFTARLFAPQFLRTSLAAAGWELVPAGLATAWGVYLVCAWCWLSAEILYFALAAVIAIYFFAGLWVERRRSPVFTQTFLRPLYFTAQALTLLPLAGIYLQPFQGVWTDVMQMWGTAAQVLLGVAYLLYAWSLYQEFWAHVGIWLGAAGAGFFFAAYSQGRGSSAFKLALLAMSVVLAERGLLRLRDSVRVRRRVRAYARLAWSLYQRPLLTAGWTLSVAAVGLSLFRNLWLLGGGRTRELWAVAGLWTIVGLYALAARLFRQARFVWLAAFLSIAPWTILTHLDWFFAQPPATLPRYAFAWTVLAWVLFLLGRLVQRLAPRAYALPLRAASHLLLPFALLWGVAHAPVSRYTYGMAVVLYALESWRDARQAGRGELRTALKASRFLYATLGLIPVWCVYLLMSWLPAARHEHYGLLLLAFGPLGLIAGQWLERVSPPGLARRTYALPAYLTGYVSLIVGTMLAAHLTPLLSLVLLGDALLLAVSAWLFRDALWVYPAAALVPISLLLALWDSVIPGDRQGWCLIGLAALYLALAWALRRAKLRKYDSGVLAGAFALIALGLPPSSRDQIGALWGYGAAALLYAVSACWLRQPLLLTPACALVLVPYAIGLDRWFLPEYHGLLLFPGALAALALGVWLDARRGAWRDFPWHGPLRWPVALAERFLGWWALPLYALGFGLATAAPLFADFRPEMRALSFLIQTAFYGWAIYRFRLRSWLLALGLAGHFAAAFYLDSLGWWHWPAWAWLQLLPVTLGTTAAAMWIERRRGEGSPFAPGRFFAGWSRPLYVLVTADVLVSQVWVLRATEAGAMVTLVNALLLVVLAAFWESSTLPYGGAALGAVALWQWGAARHWPAASFPVAYARLALGYGLVGYGLALAVRWRRERLRLPAWVRVFERPLQRVSLEVSVVAWALVLFLGLDIAAWSVRALFGMPFREIVDLATVWMVVGVLARLGLLYIAASVTYRRPRMGYGAVALLLAAWVLFAFYVRRWAGLWGVQWYAFPAGLYLIGVSALEWREGHKSLARWIDYAALVLMLGSLFWQTLVFGWRFALLLGGEGLTLLWFGSARRLRRFFYAGMVGVMLATVGQLINALQSVNQWIVFGIIGLLLIGLATLVERRLEQIKASLEEVFENWE